jgi:hypothetical protein
VIAAWRIGSRHYTKIVGGEGHLDAVLRERELAVGELAGIVSGAIGTNPSARRIDRTIQIQEQEEQ